MALSSRFASAAKAVRYVKAEEMRLDEKKRRQAQIEREKRIQDQISKENQATISRMARASEKTKQFISQRGREVQLQNTRRIQFKPDFYDTAKEVATVTAQFNKLLEKHKITETDDMSSSTMEQRMNTMFERLITEYCETNKDFSTELCKDFVTAVRKGENPTLFDRLDLVHVAAAMLYGDPVELDISEEMNPQHNFILRFIKLLGSENKDYAVNIFPSLLDTFFLPDSKHRKEYLHMLVTSGCWSAYNGLKMAHKCLSLTVDLGTKVLHKAKTYGVDFQRTYDCLNAENPLDALQKAVKTEGDKTLENVINEMRQNKVPDKLLNTVEEIVSKVLAKLPSVFHLDLSEDDIIQCIEKVKALDLQNPDVDKFVDALVDLCIGVQDYTTIHVGGEKIEGFFPRVTQLVSVVMLLIARTPDLTGCVLEINTGEGKSCIVAMSSAVLAIRGAHVDVISSSSMLARRDAEEWQPFFKMFHLTVGVAPTPALAGLNPEEQIAKQRQDYDCNIVYGTVGAFAADILRHEFEKVNIRGNRRSDAIVVDEIDYMTLDNGTQLTYLSHFSTGMRHLEQVLAVIWNKLSSARQHRMCNSDVELWASGRQHFHKAICSLVANKKSETKLQPSDILRVAVKLGLFSEKTMDQIINSEQKCDTDTIKNLLNNIDPAMQALIMNDIDEIIGEPVIIEKYTMKNSKILKYTEDGKDGEDIGKMLLSENGIASPLYTREELIEQTVGQLKYLFKYSNEHPAPTTDGMTEEAMIYMPGFMKTYISNRLPVFVDNALKAITMVKDREYMIFEDREKSKSWNNPNSEGHHFDRIIPVDFKASGILESGKQWGDGLQQFLEMKHQLNMSDMTTVTNFMSNFHFFKRYAQNLGVFGVTGTLGDEAGSNFMQKHFKVSCYPIPTHKRSKMIELQSMQIKDGTEAWLDAICERIKEVTNQTDHHVGQTVVVICEDIMTVDMIQEKLIKSGTVPANNVHLYSRSDRHQVEGKEFSSNDVILTTALGGRGTDFAVNDEVHASGGLYVLLTHLAPNRRVEIQMFGRTARKGKPGMCQMILNRDYLEEPYQNQLVKIMRSLREQFEQQRIADMEENDLGPTDLREDLFDYFCDKLNSFCARYSEEEKHMLSATQMKTEGDVPDFVKQMSDKMDYEPAMNDLKETWAEWLMVNERRIQTNPELLETMRKELDQLLEHRTEELLANKSEDFYDYMRQALARMQLYETFKDTDCGTYDIWQKSAQTDPAYKAACLYNQAYIKLNQRDDGCIQEALSLLSEAKEALFVFVAEACNTVVSCFMATEAGDFVSHHKGDSNLMRQLTTRMNLYNTWNQSIIQTIHKLQQIKDGSITANINLKSTYTFGLVDNPDPWTDCELAKLYEIGLYKMYEIDTKPCYKPTLHISLVLAQLRELAANMVEAIRYGSRSGFTDESIQTGITTLVKAVVECDEQKPDSTALWKPMVNSFIVGQSLRTNLIPTSKQTMDAFEKQDMLQLIGSIQSSVSTCEVKQIIQNEHDEPMKVAIKDVFTGLAAEKLLKTVKDELKISEIITRFIIAKCIPEIVLELDNPNDHQIAESHRRKVLDHVITACMDSVTDSITGICKDNFKILSDLRQALEATMVSDDKITRFKLGVKLGLIADQLAESLASSKLVPELIDDLQAMVASLPDHKDDKRYKIPAVIILRDEIQNKIEDEVKDQVVEACMTYLNSLADHFANKTFFSY